MAGASFARGRSTPRPASVAVRASPPAPAQATRNRPAAPQPVAATTGTWRIQLGAFSVAANARKLWQQLSGRAELAGKQQLLVAAGGMTRLQAGGFASRESADAACRSLQRSGQACLVAPR
jgi:cell division septation protein DedD